MSEMNFIVESTGLLISALNCTGKIKDNQFELNEMKTQLLIFVGCNESSA